MKTKPTQKQAVLNYLIKNGSVTGSEAYKATRYHTGIGTMNLHKIIARLRDDGVLFKPSKTFTENGCSYKRHFIDLKKTPKKVLRELQ